MAIYMNPLTDFAFKKLFGDPSDKELLIDFINSVLQENTSKITDLIIMNNEQLGNSDQNRIAVYDLYCTTQTGEHVVIEIQRVPQPHFIDRTIYYSSFLIQKQGEKGNKWNYELNSIYVISLLNFAMSSLENEPEIYYHKAKLIQVDTGKIFFDKLTFVYLELPKFKKQVEQLSTHFEKWVYLFRHMEKLQNIPEPLNEPIFMKLLDKAKLDYLKQFELTEYETTLKTLRDNHNAMTYAIEKGFGEGYEDGFVDGEQKGFVEGEQKGYGEGEQKGERKKAISIAQNAFAEGLPIPMISKLTGLSEAELIDILGT